MHESAAGLSADDRPDDRERTAALCLSKGSRHASSDLPIGRCLSVQRAKKKANGRYCRCSGSPHISRLGVLRSLRTVPTPALAIKKSMPSGCASSTSLAAACA